MENKLIHYGVEGMHWGIRRYQNYDGTRTSLGKKRERWETTNGVKKGPSVKDFHSSEKKGFSKKDDTSSKTDKKSSDKTDKKDKKKSTYWTDLTVKGKDQSPISPAEKTVNDLKSITNSLANISKSSEKFTKRKQAEKVAKENAKKLSSMSNTEVKAAIERIKLEQEYNSLTTKDFSKGHERTQKVLNQVGDLLAVAASAAAIYSTVANARKKKDS